MGAEPVTTNEEPLYTGGVYEYHNRPRRDGGWSIAFATFLVVTVVWGIFGVSHIFLNNTQNCPYEGRKLRELLEQDKEPFDAPGFFKHAAVWLVISAFASWGLGIVYILLFKHVPQLMVRVTIQVQIAVPAALGIASLIAGQVVGGIIMLVLAGLAALAFYMWRREIDLCARLLGVSAHGLNANPGLVICAILIKLVEFAFVLPIFGLIFTSYTNGKIVPNGAREGREACYDAQGRSVPCCAWQPNSWVPAYMTIASITMLWTIFTIGQLRVYVMSGTIAQWYFAPAGVTNSTKGMTMRSVKHALGPSFGTLSFGAAILTLIEMARNAMERARQNTSNDGAAIVLSILSFFMECFFSLVEYLTKFATIMASITGEDFLTAGRKATDLLKRNFLKSFGVWWFPPIVMQSCSFVLSVAWGFLVFCIYWIAQHSSRDYGLQESIILGVISGFIALIVLSFFSMILLNIVDATYLCYAIDKDTQTVTKQEVHDVFSQIPVGAAVEQPGGEVQYANPRQYVPPSHPSAAHNFQDSSARV